MSFQLHPYMELGPVKLKVSNLERSINFYKEVIGFKILNQQNKVARLSADGKETLLILEEVANAIVLSTRVDIRILSCCDFITRA